MKAIKIFILLIAACLGLTLQAAENDSYQIIYLSTPTITIGGKTCKQGQVCKLNDKIQWESPSQTMKVRMLGDHTVHTLGRNMLRSGTWSLADYYVKRVNTSTQSTLVHGRTSNKLAMESYTPGSAPNVKATAPAPSKIAGTYYLVDNIEVKVPGLQSGDRVVCTSGDKTFDVPVRNSKMLISADMFPVDSEKVVANFTCIRANQRHTVGSGVVIIMPKDK